MSEGKAVVRKTNKTQKVLEHLKKYGKITSLEAIDLYGATRLSAIIYNLRHRNNLRIESIERRCEDRYGNVAPFAEYVLISDSVAA
jgi:hypothetical protein